MSTLAETLQRLPDEPGVYIMKDGAGTIIYVGKAISLKKRVRQYFNKDKNKHPKVVALVSHIASIEYIIVDNEVEALILESNFIKENRPHYNVLLRDDKQYPYIKVTNEKFPRLLKVRQVHKDRANYFGPFPNAFAVNDLIDLMQELYSIRTCNLNFDKGQRLPRPCLNYFIDRCKGPCIGEVDEEEYHSAIREVEQFLSGREDKLIDLLTERMKSASAALNFEAAAKYRDNLKSVEIIMEKQKISKAGQVDSDLIAMARGEGSVCIQVFFMRAGKIVDREHFIMKDDYEVEPQEILSSFMKQFYIDMTYIPKEILVESMPEDSEAIASFLSQKRGNKVFLHEPKRGEKVDALDMVRKNAADMLEKYEKQANRKERNRSIALGELEELLGIQPLKRLEAYDISNISGVQSVGSMIVFENGEKAPKEYRKYKIKSVEGPDDYKSLEEVLTRRFKRGLLERSEGRTHSGLAKFPSLILMDGGKGQIGVAKKVLASLGIDLPVCGLVKDDHHTTRGIIYKDREFRLKVNSPGYRLVYKIQEEAHRFAIAYHRKLRNVAMKQSILDDVPGIGAVRKAALLSTLKSVDNIKAATVEELAAVPKMNRSAAEKVYRFFNDKDIDAE